MIKIYSAQLTDFTRADYTKMYSLLDCAIKEKIDRKKSELNKKQSLAGYILLHLGAKELYGKKHFDITFNEHGKPLCDFCFFSISHSEDHVFCAFCEEPIGVDVQKISDITPREKYKFFNLKENFYVNQNKPSFSERYIEIFTKKEAAVKMLGLSIASASKIDAFSNEFYFETQKKDGFIFTICSQNKNYVNFVPIYDYI